MQFVKTDEWVIRICVRLGLYGHNAVGTVTWSSFRLSWRQAHSLSFLTYPCNVEHQTWGRDKHDAPVYVSAINLRFCGRVNMTYLLSQPAHPDEDAALTSGRWNWNCIWQADRDAQCEPMNYNTRGGQSRTVMFVCDGLFNLSVMNMSHQRSDEWTYQNEAELRI